MSRGARRPSRCQPAEPYQGVVKRVWAFVPWLSFGLGVFGAFVMDRGPDQAWIIAAAAIGTWIVVLGLRFVSRFERPSLVGTPKLLVGAAKLSLVLATQGLMQLTLFFALPFFFYAAASTSGTALPAVRSRCRSRRLGSIDGGVLNRPLLSSRSQLSQALRRSQRCCALGYRRDQPLASRAQRRDRLSDHHRGLDRAGRPPSLGGPRVRSFADLPRAHVLRRRADRARCAAALGARRDRHRAERQVGHPSGARARPRSGALALRHGHRLADGLARQALSRLAQSRQATRADPAQYAGARLSLHPLADHAQRAGKYTCTVETANGQVLGSRSVRITGS